jgi:hypothetical protein
MPKRAKVRSVTVVSCPKGNDNLGVLRSLRESSGSRGKNLRRGAPPQGGTHPKPQKNPIGGETPQGGGKTRAVSEGNPVEVEGQESCGCSFGVKPGRVQRAPKQEKSFKIGPTP